MPNDSGLLLAGPYRQIYILHHNMLKVVCYESGTKSKPLATERDFNIGKVKQMH